ncbi:hypothetical protein Tco_0937180 [Tanacetum coccineum]|uniref:Uncharacterized protein n=1 Tax=Tanacetum coccineum TaxID=301880 RepID=A0ABQ5DEB3_9ASTR
MARTAGEERVDGKWKYGDDKTSNACRENEETDQLSPRLGSKGIGVLDIHWGMVLGVDGRPLWASGRLDDS